MSTVMLIRVYLCLLFLVQALSQYCSSDPLTEDEVVSLSSNCTQSSCTLNINTRGVNYFFPHLTFTCNGTLANWTMAGHLMYGEVSTNPTLVIWKAIAKDQTKYVIHHKTSLTYCNGERMLAISPQVYTCELQNGLPVEEGDVVGIEVPYYASQSDIFDPYFDLQSYDQLEINYIQGTSLSSFILSQSASVNSLPLLSIGVVPLDTTGPISDQTNSDPTAIASQATRNTAPRSTASTNSDNRTIVLQLHEKIGIALGAILLVAMLSLLVGIQCFVIFRIRRKRRQKIISKDRGLSLSSTEPYAMVDLSGMVLPSINFSQNPPEKPNNTIPISRNLSYATTISTPVMEYRNGDSMYVSSEDIRIRDGSYTMEELERHRIERGIEISHAIRLSPTVNRDIDNHRAQRLICPGSPVGNEALEEHHKQPDEADSGIHVYRQDPTTDLYQDDSSEHIYY